MNRHHFLRASSFLLALSLAAPAFTQGSKADYDRASNRHERTRGLVANENLNATWIDGGRALWFLREGDHGRESVRMDASTGERTTLPSIEEIRTAAKKIGGTQGTTGPGTMGFDGKALYVQFQSPMDAWRFDLDSGQVSHMGIREAQPLHASPTEFPSASVNGGPGCPLKVLNDLDVPLTMFWVPGRGAERAYGEIPPGGSWNQSTYDGHAWVARTSDGKARAAFVARSGRPVAWIHGGTPAPKSRGSGPNPNRDLPYAVFLRDHNVSVRIKASGEQFSLTTEGTREAGFRGRTTLSGDGRYVVAMHVVAGDSRQVHYVESTPRDQLQPKLHVYNYLKPGDRIDHRRPRLFDLQERREIPMDDSLFPTPWSISRLRWEPTTQRFTFLYNQRGHQVQRLIAIDPSTGETSTIIEEASPTFVNYSSKTYLRRLVSQRAGQTVLQYLWASERDGWNHLYLLNSNGEVERKLTSGPGLMRGVESITEGTGEDRSALLRMAGPFPGQDPYHIHFVRVNLDNGSTVQLTQGDGTHSLDWSPDGRHYVDSYSRVDLPPVHELRRAKDGGLVAVLERGNASRLEATGWRAPERFVAKGRDGTTDIWGIIHRPSNFESGRTYPVIESIYAGPHGAFVPKSFRATTGPAAMAELGFIVVQIDGMGTNHRGKAFHDVCWKNLGDSGFPDRRPWIEAAAKHEPAMDLTRVGIYGGSAGGQSALRALLAHGDFYHAAVADCGCHDNRVDKIWWNEAWMGWPIGPHYAEQSNVTQAHRLTGDLLLIVGETDENVDPASTMQVVSALIDADKDFELLVMPGVGHGAAGTPYGTRRQRDFFVRKLLGVEPRWE
ncbi:MAG: prolyl oligopeptidase family serine peptidase [Planctomycetota bacterium]|nr:prolyl oligopeptidase family serine peptidase [Planctomycetota bacterium]